MDSFTLPVILIIGLTGLIDFYGMVIADLSWIALFALYGFYTPYHLIILLIVVGFFLLAGKYLPPLILGLGQGDWFYIASLTPWIGVERLGLLVGTASILALGCELGLAFMLGNKIDWNKKVAWGGFVSITATVILLWP